jgi:hypothetical protein
MESERNADDIIIDEFLHDKFDHRLYEEIEIEEIEGVWYEECERDIARC